MLIVECYYTCKPGTRAQVLEYCKENIEGTRKEEGNISYMHYPDPNDENSVFVFEKWENAELFNKHDKTKHHKKFSALRRPLLEPNSFKIWIYDAEICEPVLNRVREFVKGHIN